MSEPFDRSGLPAPRGQPCAGARGPRRRGNRERCGAARLLRAHPRWRFVFVNHATTNPFFVPARYGIADAAALFGVDFVWTGSKRSDVGEMVTVMRRAIEQRADGIAVSIIDPRAFNALTDTALGLGIPVVSYNADGGAATGGSPMSGRISTSRA